MIATKADLAHALDGESRMGEILFVCTGNTCRSPMAAALFNHLSCLEQEGATDGRRLIATSAGLCADEGAPITKTAVMALEEAQIPSRPGNDYAAHRAQKVTREMVEAAILVVGITARHAFQLTLRYPEHASKITAFPLDISDPFGGDLARYRDCLAELRYGMTLLLCGEGEQA